MAFFLGLLSIYLLAWALSLTGIPLLQESSFRGALAAAVMFILVGISHFAKPEKLLAMIPPRWPFRKAMNYVSGLAECVLGVALLVEQTRHLAAYGLILLLILVFPANIYTAMQKPGLYTISRLFFQPVYILWIWWFCLR